MYVKKERIIDLIRKMKHIYVPKYQRDYVWDEENCKQLYDDLTRIISEKKQTHFFGTIVNAQDQKTNKIGDFVIIDGAQRITTISCLLIAIKKLVERKELNTSDSEILLHKINITLKNDDRDIRLTPASKAFKAYNSYFNEEDDEPDNESQITKNINYFIELLKKDKEQFNVDTFWESIESLTLIEINLEKDDDAQRIFESINSTGVALSEGDKVKNFLMMSIPIDEQDAFYEKYWKKIEENTSSSSLETFIQNFLSIRHKSRTYAADKTYDPFKSYASTKHDKHEIIEEMRKFSKYFLWIYKPENVRNPKIQKSIVYLRRLIGNETKALNTYLLQLLDAYENEVLTDTEVENCFSILENYILRRKVCELTLPTENTFIHLHNAIDKGDSENYSERLKYHLLKKEESDRYPRDEEFLKKLGTRPIYKSKNSKTGQWRNYLLEELENFDNEERIDISHLKRNNRYSIEHIMPRNLTKEWVKDLGGEEKAYRVHANWLHRIGNITLTAYNSCYSNFSFTRKLTAKHGFKNSNFSLNKFIAECDKWTETEMERRTEHLIEIAKKRWPEITTSFKEYNE